MSQIRYQLLQWVNGNSNIGEWDRAYGRLDDRGQAKADERLRYLRDQPPSMWREPSAKRLSSASDEDCKDVHKGTHWEPRDKCRIAKERWRSIIDGSARTIEIEID